MAKRRGPTWKPGIDDYAQVFQEQNPWHQSGLVPDAWAKPVERPLARYLPDRLQTPEPRRFQLILGPRRGGKTTSMYQAVRHLLGAGISRFAIQWLRLDHPLLLDFPLGELVRTAIADGSTLDHPTYLFLDEITYAEKWDLWLKTFYDENWPVRIVGSSSSSAELRNRRLESGVGRWEEQYLAPYLFPEYLDLIQQGVAIPLGANLSETIDACITAKVGVQTLSGPRRRFLLTGGFPELLTRSEASSEDESSILLESQRTLRSDAVERAIYKDIPQAFSLDNPKLLERLLYTLAGQVTGIVSPQSICQALGGLSQPTFDRYLSYLERAFLVFTLQNYSGSEVSKQKRGRKLYFVDAAVRNAALQRGLAPLTDQAEMGLLIENMIAGHLHALGEVGQIRLYHWRDGSDEVDLVYDHPQGPLAFEIGASADHHRRGIQAFMTRYPRFQGRCYIVSPTVRAVRPQDRPDGIGTLPLDLLLLASGEQTAAELRLRLLGSR
jgi:predicted AAA+ superfamily ATPase